MIGKPSHFALYSAGPEIMRTVRDRFIGDDAPDFREDQIFFANLNLESMALKDSLAPIIELICQRIEFTYKSNAKIAFVGAGELVKENLLDFLQFDDICIKILHVESGQHFYLTLGARLARTFLIRLLATSLIDETSGLLFSSTEKGLFAFIAARLLFDLKCSLAERMPDLKLIGIYHYQDESLKESRTSRFGTYNFSLSFAAEIHPVSLALPLKIFRPIKKRDFTGENLFARTGHLSQPLRFVLKMLRMRMRTLTSLAASDLILFDSCRAHVKAGVVLGHVTARWQCFLLDGLLDRRGQYHFFSLAESDFMRREEDMPMEEVMISVNADGHEHEGVSSHPYGNPRIIDLVKDVEIRMSIELSRLPMTLKELCQLKDGEIIELHRKITDPLQMVVDGRTIGYCQPVQIDGRLGIRVLSLESDANKKD